MHKRQNCIYSEAIKVDSRMYPCIQMDTSHPCFPSSLKSYFPRDLGLWERGNWGGWRATPFIPWAWNIKCLLRRCVSSPTGIARSDSTGQSIPCMWICTVHLEELLITGVSNLHFSNIAFHRSLLGHPSQFSKVMMSSFFWLFFSLLSPAGREVIPFKIAWSLLMLDAGCRRKNFSPGNFFCGQSPKLHIPYTSVTG